MGLPKASHVAWILVRRPPLLRPIACAPFFLTLPRCAGAPAQSCGRSWRIQGRHAGQFLENLFPHPALRPTAEPRCTTRKSPNRPGNSRHGIPARYRYSTASTNRRLSFAVPPTCPSRPGSRSLIRSYCRRASRGAVCSLSSPLLENDPL